MLPASVSSYLKIITLGYAIWLAQIKTVYPAIEEYREKFIDRHRSEIKKCLPVTSSYGEIYREPEDVEIGTLLFMTGENFYLVGEIAAAIKSGFDISKMGMLVADYSHFSQDIIDGLKEGFYHIGQSKEVAGNLRPAILDNKAYTTA